MKKLYIISVIFIIILNSCADIHYSNLANRAIENGEYSLAENSINEYETWVQDGFKKSNLRYPNPGTDSSLGSDYESLSILYFKCFLFEKSYTYSKKAVEIYRRLSGLNRDKYYSAELMHARTAFLTGHAQESRNLLESLTSTTFPLVTSQSSNRSFYLNIAKDIIVEYAFQKNDSECVKKCKALLNNFEIENYSPLKKGAFNRTISAFTKLKKYSEMQDYLDIQMGYINFLIYLGDLGRAYSESKKLILAEKYVLGKTNFAPSEGISYAMNLTRMGRFRESIDLHKELIDYFEKNKPKKTDEKLNYFVLCSSYAYLMLFSPEKEIPKNYRQIDSILKTCIDTVTSLTSKSNDVKHNFIFLGALSKLQQKDTLTFESLLSNYDSLLPEKYLNFKRLTIDNTFYAFTYLHYLDAINRGKYEIATKYLKGFDQIPIIRDEDKYLLYIYHMELDMFTGNKIANEEWIRFCISFLEKKALIRYDPFSLESSVEYFELLQPLEKILISYLQFQGRKEDAILFLRKRKNYFEYENSKLKLELSKVKNENLLREYKKVKENKIELNDLYSQNVSDSLIDIAEENYFDRKFEFLENYFNKDEIAENNLANWMKPSSLHIGAGNFSKTQENNSNRVESPITLEFYPSYYFNNKLKEYEEVYYRILSTKDSIRFATVLNRHEIDSLTLTLTVQIQNNKNVTEIISSLSRKIFDQLNFNGLNSEKLNIVSTGILEQLNWNLLIFDDKNSKKELIEKYEITNLSSIYSEYANLECELAQTDNICLFGNPLYGNYPKTDPVKLISQNEQNKSRYFKLTSNKPINWVDSLPGTKEEIISMAKILNGNNIKNTIYLADQASEGAMKKLTSPSVLHIATHGFYISDDAYIKKLLRPNYNGIYRIYNPQLKTGLFLSGVNDYLEKAELTGRENGIFTSYEAAELNLKETKLVVLSACRTSLGEAANLEGTCSVEKAFSIAGAQRIISTYWDVNDDYSELFMKSFYSNWINSKDINSAFRKTILFFKHSTSANSNLKNWAAFKLTTN